MMRSSASGVRRRGVTSAVPAKPPQSRNGIAIVTAIFAGR